jgi:uncharacterized protein (DUF849 family)
VPISPQELAADVVAVRAAGAFAVHLHARSADGTETLAAGPCERALAAVRALAPEMPIGLSTSAAIDPDPFARAAAVSAWRARPDFVSVNLSELGWAGIMRAALRAGIGVEAGLATPDAVEELAGSPFTHQLLRVLVEVEGGVEDARAIAERLPAEVPQLWHGYGDRTWEVVTAGATAGHDVRIGLEDVLVLPDGRVASGNAELVAAARRLVDSDRSANG